MKIVVLLAIVAFSCGQQKKPSKRSYVCPPNYIRLSHKCYYFSKEMLTWQDAFFKCRDLHGNLAIIKNANQDKLIRKTLNKKSLQPLERWLGGLYDWEQMSWKWAASGKPLVYQGFSQIQKETKEQLRWHCIIVDPNLQYKWNTRSCLDKKHFICHTKIKNVSNKDRKKLLRQYNVNKYNKLNEIPVPILPGEQVKENPLKSVNLDLSNDLNAQFASVTKQKKRKKNRRKLQKDAFNNATVGALQVDITRKYKKRNDKMLKRIKWKTYYKDVTINPLYPKAIVEEFNYIK